MAEVLTSTPIRSQPRTPKRRLANTWMNFWKKKCNNSLNEQDLLDEEMKRKNYKPDCDSENVSIEHNNRQQNTTNQTKMLPLNQQKHNFNLQDSQKVKEGGEESWNPDSVRDSPRSNHKKFVQHFLPLRPLHLKKEVLYTRLTRSQSALSSLAGKIMDSNLSGDEEGSSTELKESSLMATSSEPTSYKHDSVPLQGDSCCSHRLETAVAMSQLEASINTISSGCYSLNVAAGTSAAAVTASCDRFDEDDNVLDANTTESLSVNSLSPFLDREPDAAGNGRNGACDRGKQHFTSPESGASNGSPTMSLTSSSPSSNSSTSSNPRTPKFCSPFRRRRPFLKLGSKKSSAPTSVTTSATSADPNTTTISREELLRLYILKLDEEANYFKVTASPDEEICDCPKCQSYYGEYYARYLEEYERRSRMMQTSSETGSGASDPNNIDAAILMDDILNNGTNFCAIM